MLFLIDVFRQFVVNLTQRNLASAEYFPFTFFLCTHLHRIMPCSQNAAANFRSLLTHIKYVYSRMANVLYTEIYLVFYVIFSRLLLLLPLHLLFFITHSEWPH